jgi:predicted membrane chloride channel (bestrophin family)
MPWHDLVVALLIVALSVPLGPALSSRLTPDLVLPLLGIVASVLIGFRFSQAYARCWEARTLWGSCASASRGECGSQALLDAQARAVVVAHTDGKLEPTGRGVLSDQLRDTGNAMGGLERIRAQPFLATMALFSRLVVWLFAWLMFLRLAAYLDQPLADPLLGLPQHHIAAAISRDLLGPSHPHPLAQPPQPASATVWT